MPRPMFAYTKAILKKVSFDSELFYIEVQKAMQHLLPYEKEELKEFIFTLINKHPELSCCSVDLV